MAVLIVLLITDPFHCLVWDKLILIKNNNFSAIPLGNRGNQIHTPTQSFERHKICLIATDWFVWPQSPLYMATYWPNSHLTFPCNLQLCKHQSCSGTRCPEQHPSWEKSRRRNVLLGRVREVWARTTRVIFTGHWDKWISGSCWKLLYQNIFWPLLLKSLLTLKGVFQGISSLLGEQLLSAAVNSRLRSAVTKHASRPWGIFSLGPYVAWSHYTMPMMGITIVAD